VEGQGRQIEGDGAVGEGHEGRGRDFAELTKEVTELHDDETVAGGIDVEEGVFVEIGEGTAMVGDNDVDAVYPQEGEGPGIKGRAGIFTEQQDAALDGKGRAEFGGEADSEGKGNVRAFAGGAKQLDGGSIGDAGLDRTVFQAGHLYGELNSFLARAVQKHPTRFWALAQVSEWRLRHRSQRKRLALAIDEERLHGLYFETVMPALLGRCLRPEPAGVLGRHLGRTHPGSVHGSTALARWLRRYPDVPCLLTHGITHTYFQRGNKVTVPEEIWEILTAPNLRLEILFPIQDGGSLEYPYAERWPLIRQFYERLGPEKLIWGSDMPNVERHCTYRQSLDYVRNHCDFIPSRHMDLICGENIKQLMGATGSA